MRRAVKVGLRAALGLLMLAGVLWLADVGTVLALWRQADVAWLLVGLLAALASNVLSAVRWRTLAEWLGCRLTLRQAINWYFRGVSLNALLPGAVLGGDMYRVVALSRAGQPAGPAAWSVVLDRVIGLWMLMAMGMAGGVLSAAALAAWTNLPVDALRLGLLTLLLLWLASPLALRPLLRALPSADLAPTARWSRWLVPLHEAAQHADFLSQVRTQAVVSLGVQGLAAAAMAAGGLALGLRLDAAAWAFAVAPTFLMAALPLSVGGWGPREATTVIALAPFAVPAAQAVGASMAFGAFALAQAVLGALAFGLRVPSNLHPDGLPRG